MGGGGSGGSVLVWSGRRRERGDAYEEGGG
jgi:hypothetical protein